MANALAVNRGKDKLVIDERRSPNLHAQPKKAKRIECSDATEDPEGHGHLPLWLREAISG
jgi:hypothetical protein